jgi:aldose 1-epimerase
MNTEPVNKCGLKREDFQTTVNGKKTDLFVLRNKQGNEIAVTNYGGAVVAIMMPDKDGNYANLIQGHDNIQDVINSPEPFLSVLIGRYGNRIKEGKFTLHGKEYQLACNNGKNHLHGGPTGFHAHVWDATRMSDNAVVLKYTSPYGEEGFSGELTVWVAYTLTDDNEFVIKYQATTNKMTICNLTHHAFFSIQGIANPTPTIDNIICQVNADYYLPIDEESIPTGRVASRYSPTTTGTCGLMMPAFSPAISASVLPRNWVWSKLMLVMMESIGVMMLVQSSLPPSPTSITA